MFKKSNYNIEVETLENGNKLIFNTRTSAFGIMDTKTEESYNNIENINLDFITNEEEKKNINTMLQAGYIIKDDVNEIEMLKLNALQQRFERSVLSLTIAPTMDCNMACPYCFEKRDKKAISQEIQDAIYEFVKIYIKRNSCKTLNITWYGGEPLLQKEIIYNLSKKFIALSEELEIKYIAKLITNGVLLDRDCAKRLSEECKIINTQITIDGLPEIHNKRRILIDGRDSFNIIINNIENCKDLLKISVRVNVDEENISGVHKLSNFFINEKKWISNPVFYLAPVEDFSSSNNVQNELEAKEFANLDMLNYEKQRKAVGKEVTRSLYPEVRGNFCGAHNSSSFVIDHDGDLYKCWTEIGRKEKNFGNIKTGITINNENTKWILLETHEKCKKCEYLPICSGGCAYRRFVNDEPLCPHFIYSVKQELKIAYADYLKEKEKIGEAV